MRGASAAGPARSPGLLTGPEVGDILSAAVDGVGGRVLWWRAEQVDHQPRRGTTAGYRARVRWPDGRVVEERFGAYHGPEPPEGTVVLGEGTDRVAVWRFPYDPHLPALVAAYDPVTVAGLLRTFGAADDAVRLRLRAYRPRRRAVVEAVGAGGARLYLKVVRPARVAALHRRHRLLTAAGVPSPPSLGHTTDGLLVLRALPGQRLRDAIRQPGPPRFPSGGEILALLDRLPPELTGSPARRSWRERVGHYAAVIAGVLPSAGARARQLAAAVTAESGTGATVPVHGDFYENQLLVAGARITGLLDVDTSGAGDRLDDLACLLGHLSVLAQLAPGHAAVITGLGSRYLAAFARTVDPVDLRYRVAAVVLSLATGPHRVQEPGWQAATVRRVELTEQWVESARVLSRG